MLVMKARFQTSITEGNAVEGKLISIGKHGGGLKVVFVKAGNSDMILGKIKVSI